MRLKTPAKPAKTRAGLWKITKAAEFLDCSRGHVYHLIEAGILPRVKIGRMVRVPVDAVRRLANLADDAAASA